MLGAETRSHRRRRHGVSETSVAVVFLKVSETQTESRQTVQDEAGLRETVLLTEEKILSMSVRLEGGRRQNLVENLNISELEVIQKHLCNKIH